MENYHGQLVISGIHLVIDYTELDFDGNNPQLHNSKDFSAIKPQCNVSRRLVVQCESLLIQGPAHILSSAY